MEVAYFKVLPRFAGRAPADGGGAGLGVPATAGGGTLDHPHALAHNRARGFRLSRQQTEAKEVGARPAAGAVAGAGQAS